MQNQGNGMQNHAGSQQSAAPPAFVCSPPLSGWGGEGKGVCWGGEGTFGEMGGMLLPSCVVGLGKGLPELLCSVPPAQPMPGGHL